MKIFRIGETIPQGPRGDCFKNCQKWAMDHDDGNTFVIHGKITNIERKTYDHAWVEQGNIVIDPTQGVKMDKSKYYKLVNAQPEAKYTPEQAAINTVRSRNFGPWTSEEVGNRHAQTNTGIKTAQRMFDTYGMEDELMELFQRHFNVFLKGHTIDSIQKKLDEGFPIKVGKINLGKMLQKVIERHGNPKSEKYPKTVIFAIISPVSDRVKSKHMSAFFADDQMGRLYIYKVIKNINDVKFDDNMKETIQHELQHLIRDMYSPIENVGIPGTPYYYNLSHEVQSFCAGIARTAFTRWIDTVEPIMKKWQPQRILPKIQEWRDPQFLTKLINLFLLSSIRDFNSSRENIIFMFPELKKKYFYYSVRNFEMLLNRYLNELEAKQHEN